MKGHEAVIPCSLQKDYISIRHRGRPGGDATKRRARGIVSWPTMIEDIEKEIQSCLVCNSTKSHQQKETQQMHPHPDLPCSTLATDIFDWYNKQYLVLVDSYSGWYEISPQQQSLQNLRDTFRCMEHQTQTTEDSLKARASRTLSQWEFTHVTSSPEYAQSNGLAERAARSAKQLTEKAHRDGTDAFLNLLNLRNLRRDAKLGSPAQRLISRQTCKTLPVSSKLLEPHVQIKPQQIKAQLFKKRLSEKYDKTWRSLQPLMYRRNRRHILPVVESAPVQHTPSDTDYQDSDPRSKD